MFYNGSKLFVWRFLVKYVFILDCDNTCFNTNDYITGLIEAKYSEAQPKPPVYNEKLFNMIATLIHAGNQVEIIMATHQDLASIKGRVEEYGLDFSATKKALVWEVGDVIKQKIGDKLTSLQSNSSVPRGGAPIPLAINYSLQSDTYPLTQAGNSWGYGESVKILKHYCELAEKSQQLKLLIETRTALTEKQEPIGGDLLSLQVQLDELQEQLKFCEELLSSSEKIVGNAQLAPTAFEYGNNTNYAKEVQLATLLEGYLAAEQPEGQPIANTTFIFIDDTKINVKPHALLTQNRIRARIIEDEKWITKYEHSIAADEKLNAAYLVRKARVNSLRSAVAVDNPSFRFISLWCDLDGTLPGASATVQYDSCDGKLVGQVLAFDEGKVPTFFQNLQVRRPFIDVSMHSPVSSSPFRELTPSGSSLVDSSLEGQPLINIYSDFDGTITSSPSEEIVNNEFYNSLFVNGSVLKSDYKKAVLKSSQEVQALFEAKFQGKYKPDINYDTMQDGCLLMNKDAVAFFHYALQYYPFIYVRIVSNNLAPYVSELFRYHGFTDGEIEKLDIVDVNKDQRSKGAYIASHLEQESKKPDYVFIFEDDKRHFDSMQQEAKRKGFVTNENLLAVTSAPGCFSWITYLGKLLALNETETIGERLSITPGRSQPIHINSAEERAQSIVFYKQNIGEELKLLQVFELVLPESTRNKYIQFLAEIELLVSKCPASNRLTLEDALPYSNVSKEVCDLIGTLRKFPGFSNHLDLIFDYLADLTGIDKEFFNSNLLQVAQVDDVYFSGEKRPIFEKIIKLGQPIAMGVFHYAILMQMLLKTIAEYVGAYQFCSELADPDEFYNGFNLIINSSAYADVVKVLQSEEEFSTNYAELDLTIKNYALKLELTNLHTAILKAAQQGNPEWFVELRGLIYQPVGSFFTRGNDYSLSVSSKREFCDSFNSLMSQFRSQLAPLMKHRDIFHAFTRLIRVVKNRLGLEFALKIDQAFQLISAPIGSRMLIRPSNMNNSTQSRSLASLTSFAVKSNSKSKIALPVPVETINSPSQVTVQQFKIAVQKATQRYQEWYGLSYFDKIMGNKCAAYRGRAGFFTGLLHTHQGQVYAQSFNSQIQNNTSSNIDHFVKMTLEFLTEKNRNYNAHSYASFLIDELRQVNGLSYFSQLACNKESRYQKNVLVAISPYPTQHMLGC